MLQAITTRAFRRSDNGAFVSRNETIHGEEGYIRDLERIGSVREVKAEVHAPENKGRPSRAAGAKSSASRAAQASPQTTARRSAAGVTRAKAAEEPSSS